MARSILTQGRTTGNWYVTRARKALEEGNRVIAGHYNQVLESADTRPLKRRGLRLKSEEMRNEDSLQRALVAYRSALAALRTKLCLSANDSEVMVWSLGLVNGPLNKQMFVSAGEPDSEQLLKNICAFLKKANWRSRSWIEEIKEPVESHSQRLLLQLRTLELEHTTEASEMNEPSIPRFGFCEPRLLAENLGVLPNRVDAFMKKLDRVREELGDDAWEEVPNRKPRQPQFRFQDTPSVRKVAKKYQEEN